MSVKPKEPMYHSEKYLRERSSWGGGKQTKREEQLKNEIVNAVGYPYEYKLARLGSQSHLVIFCGLRIILSQVQKRVCQTQVYLEYFY